MGFLVLLLGAGCTQELDIILPGKPVIIVYGVVSPDDSLHRIRVSRSASDKDVSWFQDAEVFLELRTSRGDVVERRQMNPDSPGVEIPGPGNSGKAVLYTCPSMQMQTGSPENPATYALTLSVPRENLYVYGETHIPQEPFLILGDGLRRGTSLTVYPQNDENRIEILLPDLVWVEFHTLIHYTEFYKDSSVRKTIDYSREYKAEVRNSGNRFDHFNFDADWFINQILAHVKRDSFVTGRRLESIEFIQVHGTREFSEYRDSYSLSPDMGATLYSNVTGGMGLFTASNTRKYSGFSLNAISLDSLANGICTKRLLFKN